MTRSHSVSSENFQKSEISKKKLTAIWLPHDQLWAIIEGQTHSANVNHCV